MVLTLEFTMVAVIPSLLSHRIMMDKGLYGKRIGHSYTTTSVMLKKGMGQGSKLVSPRLSQTIASSW